MDYTLKKDSELERKILFLAGAPCSGKGTQSAKMINRYKYTCLAVGDHFREEMRK
jgi:adenylate kinase family enzyme